MSDKDCFDDYMDYKLSSCEGDEKPTENSGGSLWTLGILAVLWILSKLFY